MPACHLFCALSDRCQLPVPVEPEELGALVALGELELWQAELARRSFADFVRRFWPIVTGAEYRPNKITERIIAALQRVADGVGPPTCVLNCPPGSGKSTLLVLFHAFRLARDSRWRALTASHSDELAATTSRRVRRLIEAPEFQAWWPIKLRDDENSVGHWATVDGGTFTAVGTSSGVTGRRVNEIVCDDLSAASDRHSKAALEHAWVFYSETLSSRLDNDRAATIVVGQRVAINDVPGRLIAMGGCEVVSLPAEEDDGTLNAPDILPREKLDAQRILLGSAVYSAQYKQRPHDDSASMFKRSCFQRRWTELPHKFDREVIVLDANFRESKSSDFAVLQHWVAKGGDRILTEQWRKQAGFVDTLEALRAMARRHKFAKVCVESAANGHAIVDAIRREIAGVVELKPDGSKAARASSVTGIVESGAVVLPANAPWVDEWIDEVCSFGAGAKHDDQTDGMVYGLRELQEPDAVSRWAPWRGPEANKRIADGERERQLYDLAVELRRGRR